MNKNLAACAGLVLLSSLLAHGPARATSGGAHDSLDYGFKFASAIQTDDAGKGRTQTRILMTYLAKGYLDEAVQLAPQVDGWWKGVALAQVAGRLAEAGRVDEARLFVARAEAFRDTVQGWERTRITSSVAQALAQLGELSRSRELASRVAESDARQYTAQSAATVATAHAVLGDFDQAMQQVALLDGADELMTTWWRTTGYIDIGRQTRFSAEQRVKALQAAYESAGGVPGWKQSEAMRLVAQQFYDLGRPELAYEALETAETMLGQPSAEHPRSPAQLAEVARSWIQVNRPERARLPLREAEAAVQTTLNIDRPGIFAQIAVTYAALGDSQEAWRILDKALTVAESLGNARPRAMAVADVCRWMGYEGLQPTDEARARLDALYAGLGTPW